MKRRAGRRQEELVDRGLAQEAAHSQPQHLKI